MTDRYDRIREDVRFRKEVAERVGVGFEVPKNLTPKKIPGGISPGISGLNGPQQETSTVEIAVNA